MRKPAVLVLVCISFLLGARASAKQNPQSVQVTVSQANIRLEPGVTAKVIATVPAGTILPVSGLNGDWFQVRLPRDSSGFERMGYVSRTAVKPLTESSAASDRVDARPAEKAKPRTAAEPATSRPVPANAPTRTADATSSSASAETGNGLFTIFISASQRDGFFDTSKDIQDSIKDVREQLAKLAKKGNVRFALADERSRAQIVLTVVERGMGVDAYGSRMSVKSDYRGAELENTSMVAATYWVSAVLQVGTYKKEFTGKSIDSNPMAVRFRVVTFGAWGRCAEQIANNVTSWVATNATLIRRRIR